MQTPKPFVRRWLLLPLVLICVHTAMVVLIAVAIATSPDPQAGMAWVLPYCTDCPASLLARALVATSDWHPVVIWLIVGGVYWGIIGAIIQSLWRRFRRRHERMSR